MLRTPQSPQEKGIAERLVQQYGIEDGDIFFSDARPNKPWLRARALASIARKSGLFKVVRVEHEKWIEQRRQVVYQGTVVALDDRIYSLPGVATVGERSIAVPEEIVSADDVAEARALRSTLDLAGFDPLDPTSVVPVKGKDATNPRNPVAAEALSRVNDNARIHIIAEEKGLIVGKDASGYRRFIAAFLGKPYNGKETTVGFDPLQRKSFIEALRSYVPPPSPSEQEMPPEFAEIAEPEGEAS